METKSMKKKRVKFHLETRGFDQKANFPTKNTRNESEKIWLTYLSNDAVPLTNKFH